MKLFVGIGIHKQPQESGISQGGALNLNQALPASKQLNLNKLSDADGFTIQWLSDAAKNRFLRLFVYIISTLYILRRRVLQDFDLQSVTGSGNRLEHAIAGTCNRLQVKRL